MRIYVGTPILRVLAPRLVGNKPYGFARGIANTVLPVAVTSPVTSAILAFLFARPGDFADVYVASLSTSMPMTVIVNYLVIGPAVKLAFHRIRPAFGLRILNALGTHGQSLSRFLGL